LLPEPGVQEAPKFSFLYQNLPVEVFFLGMPKFLAILAG